MVEKQKASSAHAGNRAAIACRSCRQRKVKCDVQAVPNEEGCGPCRRAGKECQLDPLSDGRRTVNRKCVARLQQRIEMLEARTRDQGRWLPDDLGENVDYLNVSTEAVPVTASVALPPPIAQPPPPPPRSVDGSSPGATTSSSYSSPSFYGATCHPHVVSSIEDPQLFVQDGDHSLNIDLDPTSPHLRAHLFQSFFKYQTLWVDVVDKAAFLSHQAASSAGGGATPSRWCSRFLENAMLACGTRLSTSKSVRALGPKYCEWAKLDVLRAMSDPTPANLQGFLLLSEYEVSQGNDRPGWMYCGVACRMLSDLGLHELAGIADASVDSSRESDLAYALLSACVVYEGVWTLYLGRPSSIPRSVMDIVARRCQQHRKADTPWLNAWVGLCVPMAEITRVLNDKGGGEIKKKESLQRLAAQVNAWYRALPPELAYSKDRLINMHLAGYGIHTQYCKVQILLQRELQTDPDAAYEHALRVARMWVTYREAFGMEHIPSIMLDNAVVAATAMIRYVDSQGSNNSGGGGGGANGNGREDDVWLRQLLVSMDSMTAHFPVIARMLESLKQICGNGRLQSLLPPRRGSTEGLVVDERRAVNNNANTNSHASNTTTTTTTTTNTAASIVVNVDDRPNPAVQFDHNDGQDTDDNSGHDMTNDQNHHNHHNHNYNHNHPPPNPDTPMADDSGLLWDCFDTSGMGPAMGVFPSAAFGDFVLDMPPAVLGSSLG